MNPCLLSAIAEKLNNDGHVLGNDAVAEVIKDIAGRCLSS